MGYSSHVSAALDFEGTSLLDAPAYLIKEAESAVRTPEQTVLVRRLRAWFITPLAETLTKVEPRKAVLEAVAFWRSHARGWSAAAPEVFQLLRQQGVLADPQGLASALDGGIPKLDELLGSLTPRARVHVGAYWLVLEQMLSTHRNQVVEGIRIAAEGELGEVADTPGLDTYLALCQALAVAALDNRVPAATVEVLAVALWQTFCRTLEGEVDSASLAAALASSRQDVEAQVYPGPAVSRWKRRRGAGPRGVRLSEDFDAPLPEFEDA